MSDNPGNDPILTRFRAALDEVYGDRLEWVVLYGSPARGDHRPDSDYDIAVFTKDAGALGEEIRRLVSITSDILFDTGAIISGTPFRAGAYQERAGFMHEVRQDGLICETRNRRLSWQSPSLPRHRQDNCWCLGPSRGCARALSCRLPHCVGVHFRAHGQSS